jgi:hypothetical protein
VSDVEADDERKKKQQSDGGQCVGLSRRGPLSWQVDVNERRLFQISAAHALSSLFAR